MEFFGGSQKTDWGDRRELYFLMKRMDKRERVWFLRWACSKVNKEGSAVETRVTESSGELNEVWWDIMNLVYSFGVSIEEMGAKAVDIVRKHKGGIPCR